MVFYINLPTKKVELLICCFHKWNGESTAIPDLILPTNQSIAASPVTCMRGNQRLTKYYINIVARLMVELAGSLLHSPSDGHSPLFKKEEMNEKLLIPCWFPLILISDLVCWAATAEGCGCSRSPPMWETSWMCASPRERQRERAVVSGSAVDWIVSSSCMFCHQLSLTSSSCNGHELGLLLFVSIHVIPAMSCTPSHASCPPTPPPPPLHPTPLLHPSSL